MNRSTRATGIRTVDGVDLAVRVLEPEPPTSGVAVVVAHGFGATMDDPRIHAVAGALVSARHTAVVYDARGHGGSGGETTLGVLEQHDVCAALAVARSRAPRVVAIGASMGAIAVLAHAAMDDDLAGVVTVSSPARWRLPRNPRGVAAALLVETRSGRALARRRLGVRIAHPVERGPAPMEVAAAVTCPLAVVHGRDDRFIATREAERIHRAAGGHARLEVVDGLGHGFAPAEHAIPAVLDAVEWVLSRPRR